MRVFPSSETRFQLRVKCYHVRTQFVPAARNRLANGLSQAAGSLARTASRVAIS